MGYTAGNLLPPPTQIFQAYNLVKPEDVRVVILGQDPYHNGHAHGLAFSSLDETTPASLRTVFKEIARDVLKTTTPEEFKDAFPTNDLTSWAEQGVLLINTILTVQPGVAKSCQGWGWGWDKFTEAVIQKLYITRPPKAWVLWGKDAQLAYKSAISRLGNQSIHDLRSVVLETAHPATASYGKDGFTGCGHFSKINSWLTLKNQTPIDWRTRAKVTTL